MFSVTEPLLTNDLSCSRLNLLCISSIDFKYLSNFKQLCRFYKNLSPKLFLFKLRCRSPSSNLIYSCLNWCKTFNLSFCSEMWAFTAWLALVGDSAFSLHDERLASWKPSEDLGFLRPSSHYDLSLFSAWNFTMLSIASPCMSSRSLSCRHIDYKVSLWQMPCMSSEILSKLLILQQFIINYFTLLLILRPSPSFFHTLVDNF